LLVGGLTDRPGRPAANGTRHHATGVELA
jgi:hypothetical protein